MHIQRSPNTAKAIKRRSTRVAGVVAGSYQHQFSKGFLKGRLGVSLEYGGISEEWEDLLSDGEIHGSIYSAFRTPIGPAYVGYGWGEGDVHTWFVKLGRVFGSPGLIR